MKLMLLQTLRPETFPGPPVGREHHRYQAGFLLHSFEWLAPRIVAAHQRAEPTILNLTKR